MFEKTRTPLRLGSRAAWLMTSQRHGVSAIGCAAAARTRVLPDGMGDAAPLPDRDGAARSRSAERACLAQRLRAYLSGD